MNELKVFTNEECGEIRAMKRDGEAWFVAVDVCNALDIKNARQAVTRLDDDEKCTVISNDGRQKKYKHSDTIRRALISFGSC